jgi:hypothetical protein
MSGPECDSALAQHPRTRGGVRSSFRFFFTLQSHPAVGFYVYLLPKSTILNARARNPNRFFLRLLSRHFYPRVAIVPTIRTFFSLTLLVVVDT